MKFIGSVRHALSFNLTVVFFACGAAWADPIDGAIEAMSAEERVGQLLFVGSLGKEITPDWRRMITEWRVGGVTLYGVNIGTPEQTCALTTGITGLAEGRIRPFVAIDQRRGKLRYA